MSVLWYYYQVHLTKNATLWVASRFFFAVREMFTDVPNPAIYYFDLFSWSWLNCDNNQELRKHVLFWYFDLSSSFKAFSSFYTRHCKRALVSVMAVFLFFFSFLVKWFAVKLNKPPKSSLVQGINWLTTWPISPLEKQWSLWDIGSDLRLAYRIFFSWKVQNMVFFFFFYIPLDVCLSLYTRVLFTFTHFLCLLLQHLLCSSSRDRDGKAAKDEKGKNYYIQMLL